MNPKVSVIIPVYNPGLYLKHCIDSLINQTLKECEFIFINDGSTDDSLEILNIYKEKDSRIIIINQKNLGISIARNNGIKKAQGEYIGFSDNDDFLELDMLETLYNTSKIHDSDIVVSKYFLGRDNKEIIKGTRFKSQTLYEDKFIKKNIIPDLLENEEMFAVWNKLYNRVFINKNNIIFPPNRVIEEDAMFNIAAFNVCKKAIFIDYAGYHFREMSTSESRKFLQKDFFMLALEKYHFDYKTHFNLELSDSHHEKLKRARFINRVFYIVFICSISKNSSVLKKYRYLKKIILNKELIRIVDLNYFQIKTKAGIFEKIILIIIKYKMTKTLYFLICFISFVYKPVFSEFLRSINNKFLFSNHSIKH